VQRLCRGAQVLFIGFLVILFPHVFVMSFVLLAQRMNAVPGVYIIFLSFFVFPCFFLLSHVLLAQMAKPVPGFYIIFFSFFVATCVARSIGECSAVAHRFAHHSLFIFSLFLCFCVVISVGRPMVL